jgi:phage-related protein
MQKIIPARFYRVGSTGPEPVKEWLYSLSPEERQKIGRAIRLVELGWPVGMPTCRPLGDGIFEIRVHLDTRSARILFCIADGEMWLLHGFMKTTQKTPTHELQLARQRKNGLLGG